MDLLFTLFSTDELGVAPAVYAELVAGVRAGRQFLQTAMEQIEKGKLKLLSLYTRNALENFGYLLRCGCLVSNSYKR